MFSTSVNISEHIAITVIEIYQDWQEFCDKQHYSKMDLISMALKEYMEKYSN